MRCGPHLSDEDEERLPIMPPAQPKDGDFVMLTQKMTWRMAALALVLAGLGTPAAMAGSRVGIALLPPQPVLSPPVAAITPPAQPGYTPAPLPPQVTYFTPPQAVPFIVPAPAPRPSGPR
jgi:hypothetical protein